MKKEEKWKKQNVNDGFYYISSFFKNKDEISLLNPLLVFWFICSTMWVGRQSRRVCFGAKPDKGFLDMKSRRIRKW